MTLTLATLEQEVARRTGPFFQAAQDTSTPTTSTTIAAYMPTLKTSAVLGGPENLWLLRRSATDVDRVRMVESFDPASGRVVVDRNWYNPMTPGELADFTHLHPQQELRVAVQAGLRRCFFEDRGPIYTNSNMGMDLTATLPWLVSPSQVLSARAGWQGSGPDYPVDAVTQAGHVILIGSSVPEGSLLSALRPVWSWVNDADSTTGPTDDDDTLDVDLDYAASAGHIEAWHLFPSHMFAAAAGNLQATQQMAAAEFSRQSLIWTPPGRNRTIGFSQVVRLPRLAY